MSILQAAVPIFLMLVLVELAVARRLGRRVYTVADSVTDLGCGTLAQVLGLGIGVLGVACYAWVAAHASLPELGIVPAWPRSPAGWVVGFIAVDLGQYAMHRLSHRCGLLWAAHAVHHSSEELNLLVAARSSSVQGLFNVILALPLAVLGLPWDMALACFGLNLAHQFWVHTRLIGRLGWLEWFLVTPSHHRVHHGRDPQYLDRNYGGVLIIWDRVFGTFEPEAEEPTYGLAQPIATSNPVWANLVTFEPVLRRWRAARGWREHVRALFAPPEWAPPRFQDPSRTPRARPEPVCPGLQWYAAGQLALLAPVAYVVLREARRMGWEELAAFGFVAVVTLGNLGAILDNAPWLRRAEATRLIALLLAATSALLAGLGPAGPAGALMAASAGSLLWFLTVVPRDQDQRPEPPNPLARSPGVAGAGGNARPSRVFVGRA